MAGLRIIDMQLYTNNGDGSYSPINLTGQGGGGCNSATLECKCNDVDREKLKQILLGESHYKEKPNVDPLSYEYISDYIYKLLSFHGQYLEEFKIIVDKSKFLYTVNAENISVKLLNYAYQTQYNCTMLVSYGDDTEDFLEIVNKNLIELVQRYLDDIKTKNKIYIKKENDIMPQYRYETFAVTKTQEEIELEEKIAKLKAEYDKKVAKLREEYKAAKEKRLNDEHSKEIHDKYQSLIDAGFTEEKAWEILKTMLGEFEL